jgi:hypothetical protein
MTGCEAIARDRNYPFQDVIFQCHDYFFAGRFDADSRKLTELAQLLSPNRWAREDAPLGPMRIVDTTIEGRRQIFFIQNTLSDERRRNSHQLRFWRVSSDQRVWWDRWT